MGVKRAACSLNEIFFRIVNSEFRILNSELSRPFKSTVLMQVDSSGDIETFVAATEMFQGNMWRGLGAVRRAVFGFGESLAYLGEHRLVPGTACRIAYVPEP